MRQNGNLREHPRGGGDVLKVVQRGTVLRVFAEAPGGWLKVGHGGAEGWLHSSLVTRGGASGHSLNLTTASR
nr:SH3 domain-containing protein [Roseomonas marmotae]